MFKIMGVYGYDKLPYGSKIVLKLTLTPLFDLKKDYIYYTQERYHYKNYNEDNLYTDLTSLSKRSGKRVMKSNKPFKYIMDLSEFYIGFKNDNDDFTGYDINKYWTFGKKIIMINLPKGNYHVRLENLENVPEIKQIETSFFIYEQTE